MKHQHRVILCSLTALLAFACVGGPEPSREGTSGDWIFETSWITDTGAAPLQAVARDKPATTTIYSPEISAFGKVSWFNSIMDSLSLHDRLDIDQKEAFLRALLTRVPAEATADFYRVVAIPGYFDDGRPLLLYLGAYSAPSQAPSGSKLVLQFVGNFIRTRDTATGAIAMSPISGSIMRGMNWLSSGVVFDSGMLVRAYDVYDAEAEASIVKDAADNINLKRVNLADLYTKDEIKGNDDKILVMLDEAWDDSGVKEIRCLSRMNLAVFRLYQGDVEAATAALFEADEASAGIKDPAFRSVIDVQLPAMIELYARISSSGA